MYLIVLTVDHPVLGQVMFNVERSTEAIPTYGTATGYCLTEHIVTEFNWHDVIDSDVVTMVPVTVE